VHSAQVGLSQPGFPYRIWWH